ncbi:uncharacterized protein LOC110845658 isoform X2 [Folsomia candida]|nr:uncharacterized protein LOC110845658 isoform X2 [Folsomia candida]
MTCRRMYDKLLQECHSYSEEKSDQLKKYFQDTGNGEVGEMLYTLTKAPGQPLFLGGESDHYRLTKTDVSTSSRAMYRIFRVAKSGNASKLEALLRGVALKCAGFDCPLTSSVKPHAIAAVNLFKYREALGTVLLSKKDWLDTTILHVPVHGRSIPCIDVVLQYAQEAHRKGDVLDARDALGQTALHHAIRRKYVQVTKKLILEGADLFLKNKVGESPLELILQKLPGIMTFILDRAVTVSGEIASESIFLNIDFGILTALIDVKSNKVESRIKLSRGTTIITGFNSNDYSKNVVLEFENENGEDSPMLSLSNSPTLQPEQKEKNDAKDGTNKTKKIDFEVKNDLRSNRRDEMAVLGHLIRLGHKSCFDILENPVTQAFLDLKWNRMRYLLWVTYTGLRIGIYGLYIFLMYQVYFHHCPLHGNKDTSTEEVSVKCGWSQWTQALLPIVLVFNSVFLLHELVKASDLNKMTDFKRYLLSDPGPQVFIRLLFQSIVVGTCLPPFLDGTLDGYQYILATVGILICAGLILQVVGNSNCNFGIHSIYIHVYGKVMLRFMSVIATFSPLIISFSLAFNIMYPHMQQFSSFFRSLLRLVIMLQGEFDFEDKLYNQLQTGDASGTINATLSSSHLSANDEVLIFWSGQILFSILGCVLSLVLIDVFLGYTVSDITQLNKQAEFVRRCNQIEQMHEAERFIGLAVRFIDLLGISSDSFVNHFNVISTQRRLNYRTDMVVAFEELNESRQAQFRQILI